MDWLIDFTNWFTRLWRMRSPRICHWPVGESAIWSNLEDLRTMKADSVRLSPKAQELWSTRYKSWSESDNPRTRSKNV